MVVSAGLGGMFWLMAKGLGSDSYTGPIHVVKLEKLLVTVVEKGSLESAENSEIVCRVKAKSQTGVATTIKWIIDDGIEVKKGQLLVELDDSAQQDQLTTQKIEVDKAKADWIKAEADYDISNNKLTLAEVDLVKYIGEKIGMKVLKLNQKDLDSYLVRLSKSGEDRDLIDEGDYLQQHNIIDGDIENARSTREQWLDRASWSRRMVRKGYVSRSQAESDEAQLNSAEIKLRKLQGDMKILRSYILRKDVMEKWNVVKQAESDRIKSQAEAESKKSVYLQQKSKKEDLDEEIAKCKLFSPQDGLAVFVAPDQNRFGTTQQNLVAQGETVKEGQKLIRIPDLSRMQVNVKVHEAMVSRLKAETTRSTGFSEVLRTALLINPNVFDLLGTLTSFNELRGGFRERDYELISRGNRATVRVDAYAKRTLRGHVKSVANQPSQTDWASTDVKVYQTIVSVDEVVENLKPGFSAEVTIHAAESPNEVLTIPIQAVLGNIAMGENRKCFVLGAGGVPQERDIEVGMSNVNMVEVRSGLNAGDKVVLNPRALLAADSKLKPGVPGTGKGAEGGDDQGADPKGKQDAKDKKGSGAKGDMKAFMQKLRAATPAQLRDMINQAPADKREQFRQMIQSQGLKIAD